MNTTRTLSLTLALALASSAPALAAAVDTSKTYSSGLLIGIFLAFCALIVVVQLAPSLMLLFGFIKGLVHRADTKAEAQTAGIPRA
jgi:prepilin signal peptidase PulO-like enzyme (type II secretory pathway)